MRRIVPLIMAAVMGCSSYHYMRTDDLVSNPDYTKAYVAEIPEEQGVLRMREFAQNTPVEESYVYTGGRFYEVGSMCYASDDVGGFPGMVILLDEGRIKELIRKNDDMTLYHFHNTMNEAVRMSFRMLELETGTPLTPFDMAVLLRAHLRDVPYPSSVDLKNMVALSNEFYKEHPEGRITFKVVSYMGVVEYRLNEEGRRLYDSIDDVTDDKMLEWTGLTGLAQKSFPQSFLGGFRFYQAALRVGDGIEVSFSPFD